MHVYEILWNFLLFYPKNISTIILTKLYFIQNILQDLCFFVFVSGPIITILMASSKTAFRPFWLSAEHSRYFWMWIVGFLDCRVLTRLLAYKYSTCLNFIKNSLLQMTYLCHRHHLLVLVSQLLDLARVLPHVRLGAHQDDRGLGAVVSHLRNPLGADIIKTCGASDGKTDQEYILQKSS